MKTPTTKPIILLVDNGSTHVDAAVQLRVLAGKLSFRVDHKIHAVSLKHSNRITTQNVNSKLAGKPAPVFNEFMSEQLALGNRSFILLPLFFGKSRALSAFIPEQVTQLEKQFGEFKLIVTDELFPLSKGEPLLVEILYENLMLSARADSKKSDKPLQNIVLVDHGSPLLEVNEVRQQLATQLIQKLPQGSKINQAVMERRKESEYDFNGELLEEYLHRIANAGETQATVLLLFLLPGSHAGKDGDISQICKNVMRKYPNFNVSISPLISENDTLINCLEQRLKSALKK